MASTKTFTVEDLKQHTTETDCYLALNGKVYDITEFLDEHPGGYDIILNATGRDATEDFEEIGHSNAARDMLPQWEIGVFQDAAPSTSKAKASATTNSTGVTASSGATTVKALLPLLVVLLAVLFFYYSKSG